MLPRALPLFIMLVACVPLAYGQEASPAAAATAVVYTVQDLSGPSATHEFEQAITDAVTAEVEATGAFKLVAEADWRAAAEAEALVPRDLANGGRAAALARSLEADVAVSGAYSIEDVDGAQQIALSLQCWDAADARLVSSVQKASRFDLAFYISLHAWVAELVNGISQGSTATSVLRSVPRAAPPSSEMTFLSKDEGMEVLVAGETSAGFIRNGRLSFPVGALPLGTTLQVTKRKPGYHDNVQTVKVARQVALTPLLKSSSTATELTWTTGQLLGLGVALRGYWVPDSTFLYVGGYLYVQPPAAPAPRVVFHSDLFFGFGRYLFFPPDALLRFSLATGAGLIVTAFSQQGLPSYTDVYVDVVSWTLETRILGPTLFVRQDFKYTLGLLSNLDGLGWPINGFPPTTVGVLFRW